MLSGNLAIFIDIREGVFDILKFLQLVQPNDLIGRLWVGHEQLFSIYAHYRKLLIKHVYFK